MANQNRDETLRQNMMETKNRKRMWNLAAPSVFRSPVLKYDPIRMGEINQRGTLF